MATKKTSNLETLRQELAHAKKGMVYYRKQVDLLTKKIAQLNKSASGQGRRSPDIPKTSSDFWFGLLGKRPKTHQQVIESALKTLKMGDPSAETIRKLRLRWSVLLIGMVKAGRIIATGTGRERRFSLPE